MKKTLTVIFILALFSLLTINSFAAEPLLSWNFTDGLGSLTAENAELVQDSVRGQVLKIKGEGPGTINKSYAVWEDTAGLFLNTDWEKGMTISLWVKGDDTENLTGVIPLINVVTLDELGTGDDDSWGFCALTTSLEMAVNTNGNNFESGIPRGWYNPTSTESALTAGRWTHAVITMGEGGIVIYVDGEIYGICMLNELDSYGLLYEMSISKKVMLGSWKNNYWKDGDFEGMIDDVKLLNFEMNEDEVRALYNSELNGTSVEQFERADNSSESDSDTNKPAGTSNNNSAITTDNGKAATTTGDKIETEAENDNNTVTIIIIAAAAAVIIAAVIIIVVKKNKNNA